MPSKRIATTAGILALLLPCLVQGQGVFSAPRLTASLTWTDNISHTSHLPTLKSGKYQTVSLTTDYTRQLTRNWLLLGTGELQIQHVDTFSALNHVAGTGTLKLQRKFGLGAFAPVLQINSALAIARFDETRRSGWQYTGGIGLSKRLTEILSVSANAAVDEYFAQRPVYDVSTRKITLEGDWDITSRWRLSLGGSRTWGQYVANADPAIWPLAIGGQLGPVIETHYNTLAWEVTDSFGPGWVAYRNRDSHADAWWAELSPALTDRTSLSLRYEFVRITNAVGIKYNSAYWTAGVTHQF